MNKSLPVSFSVHLLSCLTLNGLIVAATPLLTLDPHLVESKDVEETEFRLRFPEGTRKRRREGTKHWFITVVMLWDRTQDD